MTLDGQPWFAVEAKLQATGVEPALIYFRDHLAIPQTYQVTLEGDRDFVEKGVHVVPVHRFLGALV